MSQVYVLPGPKTVVRDWRGFINNDLEALRSKFSGLTDPAAGPGTIQYQWWVDENVSPPMLKVRNTANDDWFDFAPLASNGSLVTVDGSVPMIGALDMNSNTISNLPPAVASGSPMPSSQLHANFGGDILVIEPDISVTAAYERTIHIAKTNRKISEVLLVWDTITVNGAGDNFDIQIRNKTQVNTLLSVVGNTNGITAFVPLVLTPDQNENAIVDDVITLDFTVGAGAPDIGTPTVLVRYKPTL